MEKIIPEPMKDIAAQIAAMLDPAHPKNCVFIAAGPYVVTREEGTLITKDRALADYFRSKQTLTDDDMASILGYPETKSQVYSSGEAALVRAVDQNGCVVTEMLSSYPGLNRAITAVKGHGELQILHPLEALQRRVAEG